MFRRKVRNGIEMRLLSVDRAAELKEIVLANYDHLRPWLPWVNRNYSLETALNFVGMGMEGFRRGNSIQTWLIEDEKIIGGIGFNTVSAQNRSVEIGYWLTENATGRGIITDACRSLIEHAFADLGIHRVVIRCASENIKSQAIPERLGFVREGVSRDAEWLHHRFVDLIVYSLLNNTSPEDSNK